ncbi:MAG: MBL fold metallo-hydrolase [Methanomassiliicoccales archaeon]|jgi:glyoxylase-like metal-dependent hydrolase (beta-lactamase superfamily II)
MVVHFMPGSGVDSNVVLVDGTDPILVDTGTGENQEKLLREIREATKGRKVARIILTHRHFDHVGGAARMSSSLGARLFAHPMDAAVLRNGDGWQTLSLMFGVPGVALDVVDLREGTNLSTGTHDLKVLHTPGHTQGSISLFEEASGILISGDTVFADGVGRWDLPSGDPEALRRSIRALGELEIKDIYPGHGPFVKGEGRKSIESAMSILESAETWQ